MNLSNSEQYELTGVSLCVNGEAVTCTCTNDEGSNEQQGIVEIMDLCFDAEDFDLSVVSGECDTINRNDINVGHQYAESATKECCNVQLFIRD